MCPLLTFNPTCSISLYTSISTWFSVFSVSFLTLVHLTFILALAILSVPLKPKLCDPLCHWCYFYRSSHMFVSDCISFSMTPHIYLSIIISFTSSLVSWLFGVDPVFAPRAIPALLLFCISSSLASRAYFCHTTLHCTSSNFPMLYSPFVLSPYTYVILHQCPQVLEVVHLFQFFPLICALFVDPPFPLFGTYIPSTDVLVY